jgi:hypothetical protein
LAGLIKFLIWFFLISYILKFLGRFVFPFLLKRYIKKKQSQFNQKFTQQQDTTVDVEEGKVTIKTKVKKSKSDKNDMGEYVDFEEVDE